MEGCGQASARDVGLSIWQTEPKLMELPVCQYHQLRSVAMVTRDELQWVLKRVAAPQPASFFESQILDFKEAKRSTKETLAMVADAAVCFANADGGSIVIGVNDRATARSQALVGAPPALTVEVVRRGIFDRTAPNLTTFAYELEEEGVRLLVVDVPAGLQPHANTAGLATRRLGKECRPFPPDQQREVQMARGHLDWSAESSGVAVGDVDGGELDRFRRLLGAAGSNVSDLRTRSFLESLRLIADDASLTNAGALLLASPDVLAEALPFHGYSYQYRPTSGTEATTRFRQTRPLLAGIDALLSAVESRIEIRPLNLAGGVQLQLVDYPMDALRELIVNAFLHRSYDRPGTVDIEHTPDRLSVSSPGGLVAGITPDNILSAPSTPRHRLLAETVARTRVAERTGQGVDRAYREMLRIGKEPPLFEDSGLTVRAVLAGGIGNDSFVRFIADLPEGLSRDVEVLLTLAFLRSKSTVDAKRLAQLIQRNLVEAQDVLNRLSDDEVAVLEPTRGTIQRRHPSYRFRHEPLALLARAVGYRRRTVDQTDEKVLEHIREYGFITNRTLQRMFDMNVYAARNLLTDLQARGLVTKIGTARGGPGVRYGPGESLPLDV
jgi:ATP-dependent DNA helicase RecG